MNEQSPSPAQRIAGMKSLIAGDTSMNAVLSGNIAPPIAVRVSPFNFEHRTVRVIIGDDGEPLFVARDVAIALGYAKPENAVPMHCKATLKRGIPTAGGIQQVTVIREPDVFRLIMKSKLESAERFEKWVFEEVLPTIRKTGSYVAAPQQFNVPTTLSGALRLAAAQAELIEQQTAKIAADAPKVEFAEAVRKDEDGIDMQKMANLLGYGRTSFMKMLREDHILMSNNLPYRQFIDRGYFVTTEKPIERSDGSTKLVHSTLVLGAGQVYLQRKYAAAAHRLQ